MADLEFFWDPVCPWAWITSRWVMEVAAQRDLEVRWRAISLRMVNEARYDADDELSGKREGHGWGLALLRVAAAVDAEHGNEAVGRLYTALGTAMHVNGERTQLEVATPRSLAERVLAECGLQIDLGAAAEDERWDTDVRTDTECSLERTGGNVGTPVLTFGPPDGPSFFGPVISRVPRGPEAVELWDAVEKLARHTWFAELKRSVRERPQVAS
jgi:2-hydroxychromene-2-carboxylate isomerase